MNLLKKTNDKESVVLGLENLCHLTDPLKTNPIVSLFVSKSVIIGDQSNNIREIVALHLQRNTAEQDFGDNNDDEVLDLDGQLRNLSLNAFSNSLAAVSKDGSLADAVKVQAWYSEFLIPKLLQNVKHFEVSSNDSCAASCCLKYLMTASPIALERVLDLKGDAVFDDALEFGARRHERLANEAKECLDLFRR